MKTTEFWIGLVAGLMFGCGAAVVIFAATFMYFIEKFLMLLG